MSLPLLAILTSASMSFQFHSNGWFPSVFFPVHWTSATNVISNSKSLQIGPKIILSICNEEISLRKLNIFSRVYICDWHGSIVLAASSEDKPYFVPISLLDRMKAAFIWKKAAFVVLNGEMKLSEELPSRQMNLLCWSFHRLDGQTSKSSYACPLGGQACWCKETRNLCNFPLCVNINKLWCDVVHVLP